MKPTIEQLQELLAKCETEGHKLGWVALGATWCSRCGQSQNHNESELVKLLKKPRP